MRYRVHQAFAFRSGLTIAQMIELLNGLGGRRWNERDSDQHGPYISSGIGDDESREGVNVMKIFDTSSLLKPESNGSFEITVRIDAPTAVPDAWDRLKRQVEDIILPAIRAHDVVPTDPSE